MNCLFISFICWFQAKQIFRCRICTDRDFNSRYPLHRHIIEQHSVFAYKCTICKKTFDKRTPRYGASSGGEDRQILVNRVTGEMGRKIEEDFKRFSLHDVEEKMEVVKVAVADSSRQGYRDRSPIKSERPRTTSKSPERKRSNWERHHQERKEEEKQQVRSPKESSRKSRDVTRSRSRSASKTPDVRVVVPHKDSGFLHQFFVELFLFIAIK